MYVEKFHLKLFSLTPFVWPVGALLFVRDQYRSCFECVHISGLADFLNSEKQLVCFDALYISIVKTDGIIIVLLCYK